ncbi:hypothetical protein IWQ60_005725 [Tieghemiomyces parasiticus]|uniref:Uncharacterized protein n=1 Tax=Tieghemiomyces parasiticus TaxID=78921 RepID=A0A9W8A5W7_9FUNG|nr:hypothetical protein IWQ60_005725 [Tieghemiomyces parasiticus]
MVPVDSAHPAPRILAKSPSMSSIGYGAHPDQRTNTGFWRGLLRLKLKKQGESDAELSEDSAPGTPTSLVSPQLPCSPESAGGPDYLLDVGRANPNFPTAVGRRTTFSKRVRRVFSSSSIARPPPTPNTATGSVAPPLAFTPKPIARTHSTPDARLSATPSYYQSSHPSSLGVGNRARIGYTAPVVPLSQEKPHSSGPGGAPLPSLDLYHIQTQLEGAVPPVLSPQTPTQGAHQPLYFTGVASPPPAPLTMTPPPAAARRIFRKPLLSFHKDHLGLPAPMTNMPLPTPPPRSYSMEPQFNLNLDTSFLQSAVANPTAAVAHRHPGINLPVIPETGPIIAGASIPALACRPPIVRPVPIGLVHSSLPSPGASPVPSLTTHTSPAVPRHLLNTPPGSPADQFHVQRSLSESGSSPLAMHNATTLPDSSLGQDKDSVNAKDEEQKQLVTINDTASGPSEDTSIRDTARLTPPPSPPHHPSMANTKTRIPEVVAPLPARLSFTPPDGSEDTQMPTTNESSELDTSMADDDSGFVSAVSSLDAAETKSCPAPFFTDSVVSENLESVYTSATSSAEVSRSVSPILPPSILKTYSAYDDTPTNTDALVSPSLSSSSLSASFDQQLTQGPRRKHSLRFAETVLIYETFDPTLYDRRGDAMMRLTPEIAFQIKSELNHFKMYELEVHEDSRQYTHFIP